MNDNLIFGKDNTENIISMEVEDDKAILFLKDGTTKTVDNRFWILRDGPRSGWSQLQGNAHYRWGKQFTRREEFLRMRNILRHEQCSYSIFEAKEALMVKDGYTYFKGMKPEELSVLSFDIETTSLYRNENAKLLIIANTFRKNSQIIRKLFSYSDYSNEKDFIEAWSEFVRTCNPDVITGHNIYDYDLPYLNFCAERAGTTLKLGRMNKDLTFDHYDSKFRKDQAQTILYKRPRCYGREMIDTLFLSIKYDTVAKKYESYALKKIIESESITQEGRVFYDASQIRYNYTNPIEWEKIKKYAEFDGDDALALFDLFCTPYFYMAQSVPKSFQAIVESATGSQINSMIVRSYLQAGYGVAKAHESIEYEGAISIGNPGIYSNVFKVDVASLYPSIILQYEVYDKEKDPHANFLKMVSFFTSKRLEYKKLGKDDKYYDDLQNTYKVFINSAYGLLATSGINFNSPNKAAFITETGRDILIKAMTWAKNKDFKLVNADTDSIAFTKNNEMNIDLNEQKDLLNDLNSLYPEKIRFADDGYFKKAIVFKAKNYVLWDGKKLKTKGSALKASLKEKRLKDFINDIVNSILNDETTQVDIYNRYVEEIMTLSNISGWTFKKGISVKVLTSDRTNESKVRDALEGAEFSEGDKIYMFFKQDGSLCLEEKFNGDYSVDRLLEKLYKTVEIFETVLDVAQFPNYKLKRNKKLLDQMVSYVV